MRKLIICAVTFLAVLLLASSSNAEVFFFCQAGENLDIHDQLFTTSLVIMHEPGCAQINVGPNVDVVGANNNIEVTTGGIDQVIIDGKSTGTMAFDGIRFLPSASGISSSSGSGIVFCDPATNFSVIRFSNIESLVSPSEDEMSSADSVAVIKHLGAVTGVQLYEIRNVRVQWLNATFPTTLVTSPSPLVGLNVLYLLKSISRGSTFTVENCTMTVTLGGFMQREVMAAIVSGFADPTPASLSNYDTVQIANCSVHVVGNQQRSITADSPQGTSKILMTEVFIGAIHNISTRTWFSNLDVAVSGSFYCHFITYTAIFMMATNVNDLRFSSCNVSDSSITAAATSSSATPYTGSHKTGILRLDGSNGNAGTSNSVATAPTGIDFTDCFVSVTPDLTSEACTTGDKQCVIAEIFRHLPTSLTVNEVAEVFGNMLMRNNRIYAAPTGVVRGLLVDIMYTYSFWGSALFAVKSDVLLISNSIVLNITLTANLESLVANILRIQQMRYGHSIYVANNRITGLVAPTQLTMIATFSATTEFRALRYLLSVTNNEIDVSYPDHDPAAADPAARAPVIGGYVTVFIAEFWCATQSIDEIYISRNRVAVRVNQNWREFHASMLRAIDESNDRAVFGTGTQTLQFVDNTVEVLADSRSDYPVVTIAEFQRVISVSDLFIFQNNTITVQPGLQIMYNLAQFAVVDFKYNANGNSLGNNFFAVGNIIRLPHLLAKHSTNAHAGITLECIVVRTVVSVTIGGFVTISNNTIDIDLQQQQEQQVMQQPITPFFITAFFGNQPLDLKPAFPFTIEHNTIVVSNLLVADSASAPMMRVKIFNAQAINGANALRINRNNITVSNGAQHTAHLMTIDLTGGVTLLKAAGGGVLSSSNNTFLVEDNIIVLRNASPSPQHTVANSPSSIAVAVFTARTQCILTSGTLMVRGNKIQLINITRTGTVAADIALLLERAGAASLFGAGAFHAVSNTVEFHLASTTTQLVSTRCSIVVSQEGYIYDLALVNVSHNAVRFNYTQTRLDTVASVVRHSITALFASVLYFSSALDSTLTVCDNTIEIFGEATGAAAIATSSATAINNKETEFAFGAAIASNLLFMNPTTMTPLVNCSGNSVTASLTNLQQVLVQSMLFLSQQIRSALRFLVLSNKVKVDFTPRQHQQQTQLQQQQQRTCTGLELAILGTINMYTSSVEFNNNLLALVGDGNVRYSRSVSVINVFFASGTQVTDLFSFWSVNDKIHIVDLGTLVGSAQLLVMLFRFLSLANFTSTSYSGRTWIVVRSADLRISGVVGSGDDSTFAANLLYLGDGVMFAAGRDGSSSFSIHIDGNSRITIDRTSSLHLAYVSALMLSSRRYADPVSIQGVELVQIENVVINVTTRSTNTTTTTLTAVYGVAVYSSNNIGFLLRDSSVLVDLDEVMVGSSISLVDATASFTARSNPPSSPWLATVTVSNCVVRGFVVQWRRPDGVFEGSISSAAAFRAGGTPTQTASIKGFHYITIENTVVGISPPNDSSNNNSQLRQSSRQIVAALLLATMLSDIGTVTLRNSSATIRDFEAVDRGGFFACGISTFDAIGLTSIVFLMDINVTILDVSSSADNELVTVQLSGVSLTDPRSTTPTTALGGITVTNTRCVLRFLAATSSSSVFAAASRLSPAQLSIIMSLVDSSYSKLPPASSNPVPISSVFVTHSAIEACIDEAVSPYITLDFMSLSLISFSNVPAPGFVTLARCFVNVEPLTKSTVAAINVNTTTMTGVYFGTALLPPSSSFAPRSAISVLDIDLDATRVAAASLAVSGLSVSALDAASFVSVQRLNLGIAFFAKPADAEQPDSILLQFVSLIGPIDAQVMDCILVLNKSSSSSSSSSHKNAISSIELHAVLADGVHRLSVTNCTTHVDLGSISVTAVLNVAFLRSVPLVGDSTIVNITNCSLTVLGLDGTSLFFDRTQQVVLLGLSSNAAFTPSHAVPWYFVSRCRMHVSLADEHQSIPLRAIVGGFVAAIRSASARVACKLHFVSNNLSLAFPTEAPSSTRATTTAIPTTTTSAAPAPEKSGVSFLSALLALTTAVPTVLQKGGFSAVAEDNSLEMYSTSWSRPVTSNSKFRLMIHAPYQVGSGFSLAGGLYDLRCNRWSTKLDKFLVTHHFNASVSRHCPELPLTWTRTASVTETLTTSATRTGSATRVPTPTRTLPLTRTRNTASVTDTDRQSNTAANLSLSRSLSVSARSFSLNNTATVSAQTATSSRSAAVVIQFGLDPAVAAALALSSGSLATAAVFIASSPGAGLIGMRGIGLLQIAGCRRFAPDGRRWIQQPPEFAATLLPSISVGDSKTGGFYRSALYSHFAVIFAAVLVSLFVRSVPGATIPRNARRKTLVQQIEEEAAREEREKEVEEEEEQQQRQEQRQDEEEEDEEFDDDDTERHNSRSRRQRPQQPQHTAVPLLSSQSNSDNRNKNHEKPPAATTAPPLLPRFGRLPQFLLLFLAPFVGPMSSAIGVLLVASTNKLDIFIAVIALVVFTFYVAVIARRIFRGTVEHNIELKQQKSSKNQSHLHRHHGPTTTTYVPYHLVPSCVVRRDDDDNQNSNRRTALQLKAEQALSSPLGRFFLIGSKIWQTDPHEEKRVLSERARDLGLKSRKQLPATQPAATLLATASTFLIHLEGPVKRGGVFGDDEFLLQENNTELQRLHGHSHVEASATQRLASMFIVLNVAATVLVSLLQGLSLGLDNAEAICRISIAVSLLVSVVLLLLAVWIGRVYNTTWRSVLFVFLEAFTVVAATLVLLATEHAMSMSEQERQQEQQGTFSLGSESIAAAQVITATAILLVSIALLVTKALKVALLMISGCVVVPADRYYRQFGENNSNSKRKHKDSSRIGSGIDLAMLDQAADDDEDDGIELTERSPHSSKSNITRRLIILRKKIIRRCPPPAAAAAEADDGEGEEHDETAEEQEEENENENEQQPVAAPRYNISDLLK